MISFWTLILDEWTEEGKIIIITIIVNYIYCSAQKPHDCGLIVLGPSQTYRETCYLP